MEHRTRQDGNGLVWALFVPVLRWVPYGAGAAAGYGYAAAGVGLLPALAVAALFMLWRAVR